MNLCLHKQDFSVDAEWVFFATSHGKSPFDGIGGTVSTMQQKDPFTLSGLGHFLCKKGGGGVVTATTPM